MQSARRIAAASALGVLVVSGVASAAGAAPGAHASAPRASRLAPAVSSSSEVPVALASASDAAGNQFVFWRGQDDNLYSAIYTAASSSWSSSWIAVPGMGPLGSQPTVVTASSGSDEYVYVLWQGGDGNLWYTYGTVTPGSRTSATSIGSFSAPTAVTGLAPLGSKPAATYVSAGGERGIAVFWKGTDGNLWSALLSGAGGTLSLASGPTYLGDGPLGSAPTAGSDSTGNVYVFWQGSGNNSHVWEAFYNATASTWSGPIDLGAWTGNTGSAPSVAVDSTGEQYLFWQGQDGGLYEAYWNGSYWTGWVGLGDGPMSSAPSATVAASGAPVSASGLSVAWKGMDQNFWSASYSSSSATWSGPSYEPYGPLGS